MQWRFWYRFWLDLNNFDKKFEEDLGGFGVELEI